MPEVLNKESFKALSNETRQEIAKLLNERPYTASELAGKLGKHVTTVTEHLSVLEKSGIVVRKENGNKWKYYTLTSTGTKLFKPKFYSFVITLSLSAIALIVGVYQTTKSALYAAASATRDQAAEKLATVAGAGNQTTTTVAQPITTTLPAELIIGVILIIVSFVGFGYLLWKQKKN
ncbi:MAG: winged helix-turn-helix domain-containing protein [Candidatus Aenigmatarchaeota archaeon]